MLQTSSDAENQPVGAPMFGVRVVVSGHAVQPQSEHPVKHLLDASMGILSALLARLLACTPSCFPGGPAVKSVRSSYPGRVVSTPLFANGLLAISTTTDNDDENKISKAAVAQLRFLHDLIDGCDSSTSNAKALGTWLEAHVSSDAGVSILSVRTSACVWFDGFERAFV